MNEKFSKELANAKYRKLFRTMQEVFCDVNDITIKYCFNSVFAQTRDNLPLIDEIPGLSNVYCNIACGLNGILFSIMGAKMLKEINRDYYSKDMHIFGVKR